MTVERYQSTVLAKAGKIRSLHFYKNSILKKKQDFTEKIRYEEKNLSNRKQDIDMIIVQISEGKISCDTARNLIYDRFEIESRIVGYRKEIKDIENEMNTTDDNMNIESAELAHFIVSTIIDEPPIKTNKVNVNIQKETIGENNA